MSAIKLLFIFGLLGLGSAWNQPRETSSCNIKKSVCSADITQIKETLENGFKTLSNSLLLISASLQQLVSETQVTTPPSPPTTSESPPTTDPLSTADISTTASPVTTTEPTPPLGTFENPASSCNDIPQESLSGDYWIQTNSSNSPVLMFCDLNPRNCSCDSTGGWMRVANLDMTDSSQQCPGGFRQVNRTTAPLRTCGRPGPVGCVSTTFPVHGIEYSRVCGRVISYQVGSPNAFWPYTNDGQNTIDGFYIDGVSLTHGQSPREHIWTFVGSVSDGYQDDRIVCPCNQDGGAYNGILPPFIGEDYFCDSALREGQQWSVGTFYPDDPLWDGQGCGNASTCCEFNNPPWFCKQLPQATTDDIELRLCDNESTSFDNTPLEIVDIYVK